eukprot:11330587-Alexandrium_andersonii.AAC.1
MSASLVGSEMCIRDSAFCTAARLPLASVSSIAQSLAIGAREPMQAAVSYTHLTLPTICSV